MLKDHTIEQFINEVDSKSPAPGGGSVSALSSSLGLGLSRMVGHLTVGKKKFKELDPSIQERFNKIINSFQNMKEEMITLIDKDTLAFNLIMDAFQLPKETESEKEFRSQKIEEGTLEAIKVPFRIAEISLEAMRQIDYILKYGNKNTLSDLGVSTLLLHAGLEGAIMNVKINIPGISNEDTKAYYTSHVESMLHESIRIRKVILEVIHSKL